MNRRILLCCLAVSFTILPAETRAWQASPAAGTHARASVLEDEETRRMFRQSVALGIPEADLSDLVERCREAGFTAAELRRVVSLMSRAKLAGLPHEDLLNKLREGLAKGIEPEGIEKAVESKAQTLRRAKSLVDALLTEGRVAPDYPYALKVVADALDFGASASDVLRAVRDGTALVQGAPNVRGVFRDLK